MSFHMVAFWMLAIEIGAFVALLLIGILTQWLSEKKTAWDVWNSPLVIWFLTAVCGASVAWLLTEQYKYATQKDADARLVANLNTDIKHRVDTFGTDLDELLSRLRQAAPDKPREELAHAIRSLYVELEEPPTPALPEYKSYGVAALLLKLQQLEYTSAEITPEVLKGALAEMKAIRYTARTLKDEMPAKDLLLKAEVLLDYVRSGKLAKWSPERVYTYPPRE